MTVETLSVTQAIIDLLAQAVLPAFVLVAVSLVVSWVFDLIDGKAVKL